MSEPAFLTIAEWGGTPNGWPQMTLPAWELWAHHSVTNEQLGVVATDDAKSDFRELDAIGLSRGHGGISYSYAIHPEGVIGEGQGTRRGAHTGGSVGQGDATPYGHNPHSFGVVFIGDYSDEGGDTLTVAAINSFRWLRDVKLAGLLVPGTYPTGGHQDAPGNSTGCPGAHIEAHLDALRLPYQAIETTKGSGPMFIRGNTRAGQQVWLVLGDYLALQVTDAPDASGWPYTIAQFWPGVPKGDAPDGLLDTLWDRQHAAPATVDPGALAAALSPLLPAGQELTQAQVEEAIRNVLRSV